MAKRIMLIVLGALLLVGGATTALAGGALMAVFGSSDTVRSGTERAATPTLGLVAPMDTIQNTNGIATTVGKPSLSLSAHGTGRDVFIGVGPAAAVDSYLAGAPVDRVTDLEVDPFRLTTDRQNGTTQPQAPATQKFWTAQASGPDPKITWKINDGSYRLVVMNSDASPDVAINGRFALTVPHLFAIGTGILIAGIIAALIGLLLLVLGIRTSAGPPSGDPANRTTAPATR
jgi:hypothetical protein